jgi:uncharacterized DUF497 family protein
MKIVGNLLKMLSNLGKHKVSFVEAEACIWSTVAIEEEDRQHSTEQEKRFQLLSISPNGRVLLIVFCKRNLGSETRIISARPASKKERKKYYQVWGENITFRSITRNPGQFSIVPSAW